MKIKRTNYIQRKNRVRARIKSLIKTARLSIFKSNKYIYAQVIDDLKGVTLAAAKGTSAESVGEEIAKKSLKAKVKNVVFDRGSFRYHGKLKALAEAARRGGLNF